MEAEGEVDKSHGFLAPQLGHIWGRILTFSQRSPEGQRDPAPDAYWPHKTPFLVPVPKSCLAFRGSPPHLSTHT